MNSWRLLPPYDAGASAQAFRSLDAVFALKGEKIARDPLSEVLRVSVGEQRYYLKRYHGAGKNPLRLWFGRPRVQAEWENLLAFQRWGIATAPVVAHGLERRWGAFRRGALITAELPATSDLAQLAAAADPRLRNPRWLDSVVSQLARATRILHAHRFAHNDLKWRNVLVSDGEDPELFLIDCPSGSYWWGPLLRYRIIKDLACLDKVAKYQLSRSWRLRFYLRYREQRRLTAADKDIIRRILRFFDGRE